MIVDDRLETVLRTVAAGPGAAATQMRQLIDLLGRTPAPRWTEAHTAALARLDSLIAMLGEQKSASLIAAVSLRSPILVEHLAEGSPKVALAAITAARLEPRAWLAIIPDLPVQARGFLRHRRDLGAEVEALLSRLGITDFALPLPAVFERPAAAQEAQVRPFPVSEPEPAAEPAAASLPETAVSGEGIGAIIARIEAFRRAREAPSAGAGTAADEAAGGQQTRLPFAEEPLRPAPPVSSIDLVLDAEGVVMMADSALAPAFVGLRPFAEDPDACASCDAATLAAARARLPISGGRLEREGEGAAGGAWRIDAVPRFAATSGHFTGWHARLRRPPAPPVGRQLPDFRLPAAQLPAAQLHDNDDIRTRSADRLRQMLHELRTPINAIQGFAELIQQQLLGPTPHQYRSLSASIAADAARMLAGFEDVERLAQLEVLEPGALAPGAAGIEGDADHTDLTALLNRLIAQLAPLLAPRQAELAADMPEGPLPVAVAPADLERTLWRLLALVASAASPGQSLPLVVRVGAGPQGYAVRLVLPLPAALAASSRAADEAPSFGAEGLGGPGGMLGSAFALRLCAAELRAVRGLMVQEDPSVLVTLPLLTTARTAPSHTGAAGRSSG